MWSQEQYEKNRGEYQQLLDKLREFDKWYYINFIKGKKYGK